MTLEHSSHADLTDDELLAEVVRLAVFERRATVRLIAALAEVDARRLYLGQGCLNSVRTEFRAQIALDLN